MKLKLLDVDYSEGCEEQMGTCEFCFGTRYCDNPYFIIQTDKGKKYRLAGFYWDGWDFYDQVDIVNIVDFAGWLERQTFDNEEKIDEYWLWDIVREYNSTAAYIGYHDMRGKQIYADSKVELDINGVKHPAWVDAYEKDVAFKYRGRKDPWEKTLLPTTREQVGYVKDNQLGVTYKNVVVVKAHKDH